MSLSLSIDAVDVTDDIRVGGIFQPPSFELRHGQHGLLTFDLEGNPDKGADVVFADNGTPLFGGRIENRIPLPVPVGAPYCVRCEVNAYTRLFDFAFWTKQYTSNRTLKQVMQDLMTDKLTSRGFTLHASQADGPTLVAPFGWTRASVSKVLKDLEDMSEGYLLSVSPTKVTRMYLPGSISAPVSLSTAARNIGTFTATDSTQTPATLLTGVFGPTAQQLATQRWVADGAATSWVTDIPAAAAPALVYVDNGVDAPFLATVGDGGMFEFDVPTSTLSVGTYGTPTNGTVLILGPTDEFPSQDGYLAQFPFEITVGSGDVEAVLLFPEVTAYQQALALLTAAQTQAGQEPRIFTATTLEAGIEPGQALPLNVPQRLVEDVTALVTAVQADVQCEGYVVYTVTSEESEVLQPNPLARLKRVLGGGTGGGSAASVGGGVIASGASLVPAFLGGLANSPTTIVSSEWRRLNGGIRLPARSVEWSARIQAELWTRNDGVTFKFRLRADDDTTTAESSFVTPGNDKSDPQVVTFTCVVPAGKDHFIELTGQDGDDDNKDAYVLATISQL